jgi:hypothetical protein
MRVAYSKPNPRSCGGFWLHPIRRASSNVRFKRSTVKFTALIESAVREISRSGRNVWPLIFGLLVAAFEIGRLDADSFGACRCGLIRGGCLLAGAKAQAN